MSFQEGKHLLHLSPIVKHFTVLAYVEDEDRIAEFLIEKNDAVTIIETWNALGMRSTGSHDVELNNVFVEEDALLAYTDEPIPIGLLQIVVHILYRFPPSI